VLVHAYGEQLGKLDLQVDVAAKKISSAEWTKIPIDSKIAPAPDVARVVAKWESKVSKLVDVPLGESTMRMERTSEDLRRMVERAMAEQTGSDIAWINTGNLRFSIPKGQILIRNIWNLLPFDDHIVMGKFKGGELPAAITRRYPVDLDREYTVATTDFTATNQADKAQLGASGLRFPRSGPVQRDAVIDWIKKKKIVP